MRVTKEPEERKNEILDVAGRLFIKDGYDGVKISDIANAIGVAQGTIYYYFKSKEELLDATILRYVERLNEYGKLIANDKNLNAIDKLMQLADINVLTKDDEELKCFFQTIHPGNAEMKLNRLIRHISIIPPLLTEIIEQGIEENVMWTKHPEEAAEILIAAEKVLFEGLIKYESEVLRKKIIAFVDIIEVVLSIKEGALAPMVEKFMGLTAVLEM